jgi:hypothetical protein
MLITANQRAQIRLQANCCRRRGMGVAATIETRKIQGIGVFLHRNVITKEKSMKGI